MVQGGGAPEEARGQYECSYRVTAPDFVHKPKRSQDCIVGSSSKGD